MALNSMEEYEAHTHIKKHIIVASWYNDIAPFFVVAALPALRS